MSLQVNRNQTKRPNLKYTLEFKQDAAKLVKRLMVTALKWIAL
ncbi:hypothetical protein MGMO_17c00190 [Methyloglobulus morosus KoM1]|uniref:Uncharacterized protein n=1 Tax=Methyloglobulus morosus KoM1 TaxID=1116472 RepID=V5C0G7_9GAMM|nr:hypothetical protein MGMO_17c00190 [Methyloglobulus morosus KoM1]